MNYPSIFNDVIGPIMIGPSSSHVAAAARIGKMTRCALTDSSKKVTVCFAYDGSLVTTYHSQGSDMGFACGLMGMEADDPNTPKGLELVKEFLPLEFCVIDESANHPSDYYIKIDECNKTFDIRAISTGGGMIEIYSLDGFNVSIKGDRYVTVVFSNIDIQTQLEAQTNAKITKHYNSNNYLFIIFTPENITQGLEKIHGVTRVIRFLPVLSTLSADSYSLPFIDYNSLLELIDNDEIEHPLSSYALNYEIARGHCDAERVFSTADKILDVMQNSINLGMIDEYYPDRLLQSQAYRFKEKADQNILLPVPMLNTIITYITAVMESKSSMKPIVAAPTAGSCGCLPGTIFGCVEHINATHSMIRNALLSAGIIGVFFASQATFAAEVGGCQMECGAASGMVAAALCELMGGSAKQSLVAASIALQGITGLACDPVASRVESPCLNKNIMAGANAITSANMALAGFKEMIPLNETIDAIYEIGKSMDISIRCTCGGLGNTPTSLAMKEELEQNGSLS